jgi:cell division protein FtsW (lipid II flippase)
MDKQKLAEHVFNGSLAILAVLIAVAGILSAEYAKPSVSGNQDVEPAYRLFLWATASLAGWACLSSFVALAIILGRAVWTWVIVVCLCILLLGSAAASFGIVIVTLYY